MKGVNDKANQDIELTRRVAQGDENAFEQLVSKYQHPVSNTTYRYIGDPDEAEDIAQEVFIKVWRNAKNFRARSEFSTWLYRIVVNQCLNHTSKCKERLASLDETMGRGEPRVSSAPDVEFERRERAELVRIAIDGLAKRQRIALILSQYEGKSYKEIAQIMGASLSSVTSLIFRAKDNLRKRLLPLRETREI